MRFVLSGAAPIPFILSLSKDEGFSLSASPSFDKLRMKIGVDHAFSIIALSSERWQRASFSQ